MNQQSRCKCCGRFMSNESKYIVCDECENSNSYKKISKMIWIDNKKRKMNNQSEEKEWLTLPFWLKIQRNLIEGPHYLRCQLYKDFMFPGETSIVVEDNKGNKISGFVPNCMIEFSMNLLIVEVISKKGNNVLIRIPGQTFATRKIWVKMKDLYGG